jgi:hypothetical protein
MKYRDGQSERDIEALRSRSTIFDHAMRELENDHSVLVWIGRGYCGASCPGRTSFPRLNRDGQLEIEVIVNDAGVAENVPLFKFNGGISITSTLAHEVFGHAVPFARGENCQDGPSGKMPAGTPASQSCSVTRENRIRKQLHMDRRKRY